MPVRTHYLRICVRSVKLIIMPRKLLKLDFRVLDLSIPIPQLYLDPLTFWS